MAEFELAPLESALKEMEGRSALLPALHRAQELYGYLPVKVRRTWTECVFLWGYFV